MLKTQPSAWRSSFRLCRLLLFLVASAATGAQREEPFLGPIPVQFAAPGQETVLDMHRFYHPAAGTKLDFASNDNLTLGFDAAAFQLHIHPEKAGLFDVELSTPSTRARLTTVLTVAATFGPPLHHFVFKPTGALQKIYLAGSFNGWSNNKTPLSGPDQNGDYIVDLPLEPGRYSYKFLIDGKWALDPNNPQTEDNGLGDKNSVVTIAAEQQSAGPTIYAQQLTSNQLKLRVIATRAAIERISAIFEDAAGSKRLPAKLEGDEIEVSLPKQGNGFIRVIGANSDAVPSNVVRCAVGSSQRFHWQDAVMYYAFTDRFADGDKSNDKPVIDDHVAPQANYHGGDLRGIRDKIDNGYFESLGVNTVWVAPLNRNPDKAYQESPEPHRWYTGYHGYWPVSSTEIDPHIGTAKDLHALIDHAHAHGMKVIADLVLHHVHQLHPWWKQHRDWFGTLELPNGRKNLRLWDEQQFTTWFEPYLPSFDFSKDAPARALIENSVWWANTYKLDGFRLDAVKHILPNFWWKFRAALREQVDHRRDTPLYLVGETFKDRSGIMSFVGPNMLDGQFDFPLYDQIKDTFALTSGDMKAIDDALNSSEKVYGKETLMSPLIGNHDKSRFMAYADGDLPDPSIQKEEEVGWKKPPKVDDPSNYSKLELAQAFLMSIDGVPMIYYGDEIGMTGAGDPDNRRDMRFGNQLSSDEKRVLDNFKKLGAIRRAHPALRWGSRRTLVADHNLYAFVRAHLNDRVAVIFNRSKSPAKVDIAVAPEMADDDYTEALSAKAVVVKDGKLEFTLPAQTAAFVSK
jgi:cyclomaltodextrinase / maltogenic alpha-amylase / neopullulanase